MEKYKIILDDNNSKYIQIYNYIKQLIVENKIEEHEKLPPIRKFADFIGVNNATIVKVYELLEKEGYVYKIIGSGTFASSKNIKKKNDNQSKKDVIHFETGNPSLKRKEHLYLNMMMARAHKSYEKCYVHI